MSEENVASENNILNNLAEVIHQSTKLITSVPDAERSFLILAGLCVLGLFVLSDIQENIYKSLLLGGLVFGLLICIFFLFLIKLSNFKKEKTVSEAMAKYTKEVRNVLENRTITWLENAFEDYPLDTQEKAVSNASVLMKDLGFILDSYRAKNANFNLKEALGNPAKLVLLKDTIIDAAQMDDHFRKKLLAHILANGIVSEINSAQFIVSKIALNAIPQLTEKQLKLLGFQTLVMTPDADSKFLETNLNHYSGLKLDMLDIMHLLAVSCESMAPKKLPLQKIIPEQIQKKLSPNANDMLKRNWEDNYTNILFPTSVGAFIGGYVHFILSGTKLTLDFS